ncbi:MAG TPA: SDR family NAD(P)-dependent oxidoreductase [bacterium]|jgi:NAD(P)-dependent dehydrogenase (short-subunit alcohol dehydrogenase family)|nr:SDR family NAD(P)-dependent oxidoreductase [bacterium]
MVDLAGKRILISGASEGLGRALAVALGAKGARLALLARSGDGLAETAALALQAGAPQVLLFKGDVSKPAARALADRAARRLGGLDVLVNNAGVHAFAAVADMPEALLLETLQVNLLGPLRLIQGALPHLRDSQGTVVNVGSSLAWRAIPHGGAYSASKAALSRLGEALRDEEAFRGLRVLQFDPGVVATGLRSHALRHGVDLDENPAALPYPRGAGRTARELVRALERGRSRYFSAAWQVRLWAKVLAPFFGGSLDGRMRMRGGE